MAALAFLLDRALEKKLRAAGSGLSSAAAWRALETVRVVELELGQRRKRCVTRGSRQAAEVLRVLGLSQQLERGFAQLKGLLQVRPVYHRRDEPRAGAYLRGGAGVFAGPRPGEEAASSGQRAILGARPGGPWRRCGWSNWSWASGANAVSRAAAAKPRKCCGSRGGTCRNNSTRRRPPAWKPSCSDQNQKPPPPFQSVSSPKRKHALAPGWRSTPAIQAPWRRSGQTPAASRRKVRPRAAGGNRTHE